MQKKQEGQKTDFSRALTNEDFSDLMKSDTFVKAYLSESNLDEAIAREEQITEKRLLHVCDCLTGQSYRGELEQQGFHLKSKSLIYLQFISLLNKFLMSCVDAEDGDTSETMRENATAAQEQKQRLVSEVQSRVGIPRGYCFEQHLFGFVFEVAGN